MCDAFPKCVAHFYIELEPSANETTNARMNAVHSYHVYPTSGIRAKFVDSIVERNKKPGERMSELQRLLPAGVIRLKKRCDCHLHYQVTVTLRSSSDFGKKRHEGLTKAFSPPSRLSPLTLSKNNSQKQIYFAKNAKNTSFSLVFWRNNTHSPGA